MQRFMVLVFIVVIVGAPWLVGDVFPSTTAARFRDPVAAFVRFRVFDPVGRELPPAAFGLQRHFAGLPVGLGAGRIPAESLNRMGAVDDAETVPTADQVRDWVGARFAAAWEQVGREDEPAWSHVEVQVQCYGAVGQKVALTRAFPVIVFRTEGGQQ